MSVSSSLSPLVRRSVGFVVAPVLAVGALAALPAPSYAAEPDPTPVTNGASWLAGQVTDGAVSGAYGPDYGLTIDAGLALLGVDAQPEAVSSIVDRLDVNIGDYVTGEGFGDAGSLYAGAAAKAAAFVTAADGDATSVGGRDLIADVEQAASDEPAIAGRLQDTSTYGDYANTIGQAFAVRALAAAESPETDAVVGFLLDQQCSEGFFRLSFAAPDAADQTCDGDPESSASTDVTALALLNLQAMGPATSTGIEDAKSAAVEWLLATQGADGSWGGDAPTTAPNANSTGLAAWALDTAGFGDEVTSATESAAVWLRAHQADDFGPCTTGLTGSTGAIAYDDASLATGRNEGPADITDQLVRTTAQALPGLLSAPAGDPVYSDVVVTGFVRAGSSQRVDADGLAGGGLAPGQTVCFARKASQDLVNADAAGTAVGTVKLPEGSGRRVYRTRTTDGVIGTTSFQALAAKTLKVNVKNRVPAKSKQKIVVKGLAKGESVTVIYRGRPVAKGTSGANHRFTTKFKVGKRAGKERVKVRGEFGNRTGADTFRVKG